jgi:hypothetical protein
LTLMRGMLLCFICNVHFQKVAQASPSQGAQAC